MNTHTSIAFGILLHLFECKSTSDRTEENLDNLINTYSPHAGLPELSESEKKDLKDRIYSHFYKDILNNKGEIEITEGITLHDPKLHVEWDICRIKTFYWNHFYYHISKQLFLKHKEKKAARILHSLDKETSKILNCIEDPRRDIFSSKGLVVGFVQSGKTQNFTGLIAKAADAGYKLIIVLAGMYNSLRLQTQIRIDKELTGYNTLNLEDNFVEWADNSKRWEPLTSAGSTISDGSKGEFGTSHKSFNDIFNSDTPPVIAVIKKHKGVLDKFENWISNTSNEIRSKIPLLLIDDEADQASIDTTKDDDNSSAINAGIRSILSKFKKHSYIGYTATPFANVLIGRDKFHPELESDLYPRNFIHTLPEPEGYIGTFTLFAEEYSNLFHIEVPENEKNEIIKQRELPDELDNSILTFLICVAFRYFRGDANKPMSMLIHVDHRISGHRKCTEVVESRINTLKTLLGSYTLFRNQLLAKIGETYLNLVETTKKIQANLNYTHSLPSLDFVMESIPVILNEIQIFKLNSDSDDELDYVRHPDLKVIAIGGNQLSRGLTLEGLMTTYFMRDSKQYDTLLQMGRWFGYRPGFEDLVRIYTPTNIRNSFTHLAAVERELRENLTIYMKDNVTPAEIAPIIRDHTRLNVTSRNKMGAGEKIRFYGKTIEQTIWFPLNDIKKLKKNVETAEFLLSKSYCIKKPRLINGSFLFEGIALDQIIQFLNDFQRPDINDIGDKGIDIADIVRYSHRHDLVEWNICVASSTRKDIDIELEDFGPLSNIKPFIRSRKKSKSIGAYNLGVLSSKNHFRIDLKDDAKDAFDERKIPLLVFYKIYRYSTNEDNPARESLFEGLEIPDFNPVGFAIVFPASIKMSNEYDYIGQIFD